MKTLPSIEISDQMDELINHGIEISELRKEDVIRQALKIGLPQFAARFDPPPLWLEERIREALAEPGEVTTLEEVHKKLDQIANEPY